MCQAVFGKTGALRRTPLLVLAALALGTDRLPAQHARARVVALGDSSTRGVRWRILTRSGFWDGTACGRRLGPVRF